MAVISTTAAPIVEGAGADGTWLIVSDAAGPTDSVRIETPWWLPHCFLSVRTFNSAGAEIVDVTGVFTITVLTKNAPVYESIDDGPTITAATITTSSWNANTEMVNVAVTTPLTNTITWKVYLTLNRE